MVNLLKGRTYLDDIQLENTVETDGEKSVAVGGVVVRELALPVRKQRFTLTSLSVEVDADDDFGSAKVVDLPAGAMLVVGAVADLTFVGSGGISTPANVDVALGTAATASADFSNANEDNILAKIDATAGSVVQGGGPAASIVASLAAGAKSLYLNVGVAIAADGAAAFSGTIDLTFIPLGGDFS